MSAGLPVSGERVLGWTNRPRSPGAGVIPWEKGISNWMVAFPTRPGSVVVKHLIIISLLVTSQTQEKLRNITADLREEIRAAVAQQKCMNGTCEPPSKGMGRSWVSHGVGDSFPPTRNLTVTPGSGLWGTSPMLPLLQVSCASTPPMWWSATVHSTSTKRVSGWGCHAVGAGGMQPGLGWLASPQLTSLSSSSLLPADSA